MNALNDLDATLTQADAQGTQVLVLAVNGQIHHDNVDELERLAAQAYEDGARRLLLDVSTSSYTLNSAGLRAIVSLYRIFDPDQVESTTAPSAYFKLVVASSQMLRTLRVAGFEPYVEIYPDRATALKSFG